MEIRELDRRMRFGFCSHPVLGHASIAVTDVEVRTASLNAVPDRFTIYLDRRTTVDETAEGLIAQVRGLIADYMQKEIIHKQESSMKKQLPKGNLPHNIFLEFSTYMEKV